MYTYTYHPTNKDKPAEIRKDGQVVVVLGEALSYSEGVVVVEALNKFHKERKDASPI